MTTVDRALTVVGIAIICLTVITVTVVRRDWRPMVRIRRLEKAVRELDRRPVPQWQPPQPQYMPPVHDVTAVLPQPVRRVRVDMEAS